MTGPGSRLLKLLQSEQGRKNCRFFLAKKINPLLRKLGYTLMTDHFYQVIPNDDELRHYQGRERPVASIAVNMDEQLRFAAEVLTRYSKEYNDPAIFSAVGYDEERSGIKSGDAEFLFSLVRHLKPKKIIEIGAGGSTLLTLAALMRNHMETGIRSEFISIEPFPNEHILALSKSNITFARFRFIAKRVQEIEPTEFLSLGSNDILFVDSSHVFKQNSDVEYEFMNVYPILQKDVYVHIHDIFLPYDYPYNWNARDSRFWNEQYHLETFLLCNDKYAIVACLSMLNKERQSLFLDNIKCFHKNRLPGSFWMKVIR